MIEGLFHNDDPDAANLWMSAPSFWTQPAGEVHITSAKGENLLALVEIDHAPYLVQPPEEAFDNGERPINQTPDNIIWLDASEISWLNPSDQTQATASQIAFLWGKPQQGENFGSFLKLPAGFEGEIMSHAASFQAVLVQGPADYRIPAEGADQRLENGSYFHSLNPARHLIKATAKQDVILYIRANGFYQVTPAFTDR
ncbi:MAG: DUF4437 domain-containing protein [Bacteroidota bacterium]